jgi:hypothetical protein
MNDLIGAVQPVLKELHFRKRRRAFNRTSSLTASFM